MKHFAFLISALVASALCLTACHSDEALPRAYRADMQAAGDSVFMGVNHISSSDLHSLLVVQDGKIVYEKYAVGHSNDELHILWSATKSFTAIAAGFAQQDGLLDWDDLLIDHLPDSLLQLRDTTEEGWNRLTLHHLAIMGSGLPRDTYTDRIRGGEQFSMGKEVMQLHFDTVPGAKWRYNNIDTYMLSLAVVHATGMELEDYLRIKLFEPLGMTDYFYEQDSEGHNPAAFGLHMTSENLARVGQWMLQRGEWNGVQLLNEDYFDRAMQAHIYQVKPAWLTEPSDWFSGYCYQMWHCKKGNAVRFDGMWQQFMIIMPDKNAVAVMTGISTDREAHINCFWEHIYDKL